jgi:hypothetical protein
MRQRVELRDMRSLERPSMYSIFHPLDPNERLPRELILEGRRQRFMDFHHREIAGLLYLPALVVATIVLGGMSLNPVIAFIVAAVVLGAFFAFVVGLKRD